MNRRAKWISTGVAVLAVFTAIRSETANAQQVRYGDRVVNFGTSAHDQNLKAEFDSWYPRQLSQDCEGVEKKSVAVEAVRRALNGDSKQTVFGPPDPYKRSNDVKNLRSRSNPKGEGTIVHGWIDSNSPGSADFRRNRFVWLFLDDTIYPLHIDASGAMSKLFDGVPESVQERAGLVLSYRPGKGVLDQLGIEEDARIRFQAGSAGNPFPDC